MRWNLWIWEQPWRVIASYDTFNEAVAAGKRSADPPDTWRVARAGGRLDEHIRQHANERQQPAVK